MSYLPLLIAQSDPWKDVFFGLESEEYRIAVIVVAIGCSTLLLLVLGCVLMNIWGSVRQKQIDSELKQDMLDRGMTAEQIEQVIKAQPKEGIDHWLEVWAKKKK